MKKSELILLMTFVFFGAWALGYGHRVLVSAPTVETGIENLSDVQNAPSRQVDHLVLTQSNSGRILQPALPEYSAEALADPLVRESLEKKLREVPYAVLKQIYLERQDEQWKKQQERYPQPQDLDEDELNRRGSLLFDRFRQNAGENSYFVSRGEWRLRGKARASYVVLVEYYSSSVTGGGVALRAGSAGAVAKNARELCYVSTIYIRVGEKYAADGQSSCIAWVPARGENPFVIHSNYNSKSLVRYFDALSIALPGFGGDAVSEWRDSASDRWTSLGRVPFDPVSKGEFTSLSRDLQVETQGD